MNIIPRIILSLMYLRERKRERERESLDREMHCCCACFCVILGGISFMTVKHSTTYMFEIKAVRD